MLLNDFSDEQVFCSFIAEEQERNRAIANMIGIKVATDFFKSCGLACSTKTSLHKIKRIFQDIDIADIYIGNLRLDVRLSLDANEFCIPKKHFEMGVTPDLYMLIYYDKVSSKANVCGFISPKDINTSISDNYYYYIPKSVIASFEETAQLFDTATAVDNELPINIKKKILQFIDDQLADKSGFYQELASSKKARELLIEALYAQRLLSVTRFTFEQVEEVEKAITTSTGKDELYDLGFADGLMASELTASITTENSNTDTDETIPAPVQTELTDSPAFDLDNFIEETSNSNVEEIVQQDVIQVPNEELSLSLEPVANEEPAEVITENTISELAETATEIIQEDKEAVSNEIDLDNFTDEVSEQEMAIEQDVAIEQETITEGSEVVEVEEQFTVETTEQELDFVQEDSSPIKTEPEFTIEETATQAEDSITVDFNSLVEDIIQEEPAESAPEIELSADEDFTLPSEISDTITQEDMLDFSTIEENEEEEIQTEAQTEEEETLQLVGADEVEQYENDVVESLETEMLSEEALDVTPLKDTTEFSFDEPLEVLDEIAIEDETLLPTEEDTVMELSLEPINEPNDISLETNSEELVAEIEEEFSAETEPTLTEDFSLEETPDVISEIETDNIELTLDAEPTDLELDFGNDNLLLEDEPIELLESSDSFELEDVNAIQLDEPSAEVLQETPLLEEDAEVIEEPEYLEVPEETKDSEGLSFNDFAEDIEDIDRNTVPSENSSQYDDSEDDEDEEEESRFDKYDNLDEDFVPDFAAGEFNLVGHSVEEPTEEEAKEAPATEPLDIQATMEGFVNTMAPEDSLSIVKEPEQEPIIAEIEENNGLQELAENDDSVFEEIAEPIQEEPVQESVQEPVQEAVEQEPIETDIIEAVDSLYEENAVKEEPSKASIPHKKAVKKSNGLHATILLLAFAAVGTFAWFNKDIILEKFGMASQTSTDTVPNELATPIEAKNTQAIKEQKIKAKAKTKKTEAEELLNDVEEPVELIDTSVSVSQLSIDCDVPSVLITPYSKRYLIKLAKRTQLELRNALLIANGQPLANKIVIDLSVSNDTVKFEKISSLSGSKKVDAITTATVEDVLKDTQPYAGTFGKNGGNIRLIVKF